MANGGFGDVLDSTSWESVPWNGTWASFGPEAFVIFDYNSLAFANGEKVPDSLIVQPVSVIAYLSADPNPDFSGSNFTIGSGNTAEVENLGEFVASDGGYEPVNKLILHNDSCQQWYVRLVVQIASVDAGPGPLPTDASTDQEPPSSEDAGPEASPADAAADGGKDSEAG